MVSGAIQKLDIYRHSQKTRQSKGKYPRFHQKDMHLPTSPVTLLSCQSTAISCSFVGHMVMQNDPPPVSYNFPQALIAVVQLVHATFTLLDSFGGQIHRYGFAAFGLTVTPYALMSFINLLGGLLTPKYSSLYLVRTSVMLEAIGRGSQFDGIVGMIREGLEGLDGFMVSEGFGSSFRFVAHQGSLKMNVRTEKRDGDPDIPSVWVPSCGPIVRHRRYSYDANEVVLRNSPRYGRKHNVFLEHLRGYGPYATILTSAVSVAIIGGMSGFRVQDSTLLQRIATFSWVIMGIFVGSFLSFILAVLPEDFGLFWVYVWESTLRLIVKGCRGCFFSIVGGWFGESCGTSWETAEAWD